MAGAGSIRVEFPETDVSYIGQTGTSGTAYQWASGDGTAAGLAPIVPFGGYLSCNAGSGLANFLALMRDNEDTPSIVNYNFDIRFTTPTAGITGISFLFVDIETPTISSINIFANRIRMNTLGTSGSDTVFQGNGPFIHNEIGSPNVTNPANYTFTIVSNGPVLTGRIDFDVTISGTFGSNISSGVRTGMFGF